MNLCKAPLLLSIAAASFCLVELAQSQTFSINQQNGIIVPSFRDLTNADLGNTTFFGWGSGGFEGTTDDELIDNPLATLGPGGLTGTLNQKGSADILAGSSNIYNGTDGRVETLTLQIPTNGTPGMDGFTTIIFQGLTSTGGPGGPATGLIVNFPEFGKINDIEPTFVIGLNAGNQGQWWVKYEIPGNQLTYSVDVLIENVGGNSTPLTISTLTVDTVYSTQGYATDTTVVPEPATAGMIASAGLWMMCRRRRKNAIVVA